METLETLPSTLSPSTRDIAISYREARPSSYEICARYCGIMQASRTMAKMCSRSASFKAIRTLNDLFGTDLRTSWR